MTAYYNEIDPFAAAWLGQLIADDLIPAGVVDTRSIADVQPSDLRGFTQCHFFAGIGVWPLAARLVGWPDDRPLDSGSCPCPPFSSAGPTFRCPRCDTASPVPNAVRTGAFNCVRCDWEWQADERHLWPEFFRLIRHRPHVPVVGEQVASRDGRTWIDIVRASLEMLGRPVGVADTCAAGFGAPHIRQRLYWLADTGRAGRCERDDRTVSSATGSYQGTSPDERNGNAVGRNRATNRLVDSDQPGLEGLAGHGVDRDQSRRLDARSDGYAAAPGGTGGVGHSDGKRQDSIRSIRDGAQSEPERGSAASGLAEPHGRERDGLADGERRFRNGASVRWDESDSSAQSSGPSSGLADGPSDGRRQERSDADGQFVGNRPQGQSAGSGRSGSDSRSGPTNGFWRDADWLFCRDGKWRPVEPSSELMVDAGAIRRAVAAGGREDRQEKGSIIRYSPLAQAGQYVNRVDELKGAGNAVNVAQAAGWLRAVMETIG